MFVLIAMLLLFAATPAAASRLEIRYNAILTSVVFLPNGRFGIDEYTGIVFSQLRTDTLWVPQVQYVYDGIFVDTITFSRDSTELHMIGHGINETGNFWVWIRQSDFIPDEEYADPLVKASARQFLGDVRWRAERETYHEMPPDFAELTRRFERSKGIRIR